MFFVAGLGGGGHTPQEEEALFIRAMAKPKWILLRLLSTAVSELLKISQYFVSKSYCLEAAVQTASKQLYI